MRTTLASHKRAGMTGADLKRLRREGYIPATISTRGGTTQHCSVSLQKLTHILANHGASALIEIEGSDEAGGVLVISRDIQRNGVTGQIIHVGFQRLSSLEPITADVRLTLVGLPDDVRIGAGTLGQELTTVQVRATPDKLPDHIEVDVSEMQVGTVLHLADVPAHKDYVLVTPPETVIAILQLLRGVAAPEAAAEPVPDLEKP